MIGSQMETLEAGHDERMGSYVRQLRRARGLTLTQLAELVGLSQPFLSQLERGQARPSMTSLARIAQALGSSEVELVAGAAGLARPADEERHSLVRADQGEWGRYGLGEARLLVQGDRPFSPMLFAADNADPGDFHRHPEDEFLHVRSGTCTVELGETVVELSTGDSLCYGGGTPHRWYSRTGSPYELFVVKQHLAVYGSADGADPGVGTELRGVR
jgi:transcriptional regulator with XRE-family HTH domain